MEEVKFKVWVENHKKIYKVLAIDFLNKMIYVQVKEKQQNLCEYLTFKECKLMQFAGMKDKNDIEIYEGDIVKYTFDFPDSPIATENGLKTRIAEVFWQEFRGSFAVYGSKKKLGNNDLFNFVRNGNTVEVIGNIYENKELLEVEE